MLTATYCLDPKDPARFVGLREAAERVIKEEQQALVVGNLSAGIFEMYLLTRGFKDGYADFIGRPALSQKIMHRFMDMQLAYWEKMFDVLGNVPPENIMAMWETLQEYGTYIS
ncbi:MAG: hypothetical protein IMZ59_07195 [Actinobacteria bacterium]|nr:hypothetical protein [Actinomycetota bacterium]